MYGVNFSWYFNLGKIVIYSLDETLDDKIIELLTNKGYKYSSGEKDARDYFHSFIKIFPENMRNIRKELISDISDIFILVKDDNNV